VAVLAMRERIRPYLDVQMVNARERGIPPMRPLFVDFPDDARSWAVEDEFLLGPDILVAPVLARAPGAATGICRPARGRTVGRAPPLRARGRSASRHPWNESRSSFALAPTFRLPAEPNMPSE
jgi:hypothetical protein